MPARHRGGVRSSTHPTVRARLRSQVLFLSTTAALAALVSLLQTAAPAL